LSPALDHPARKGGGIAAMDFHASPSRRFPVAMVSQPFALDRNDHLLPALVQHFKRHIAVGFRLAKFFRYIFPATAALGLENSSSRVNNK